MLRRFGWRQKSNIDIQVLRKGNGCTFQGPSHLVTVRFGQGPTLAPSYFQEQQERPQVSGLTLWQQSGHSRRSAATAHAPRPMAQTTRSPSAMQSGPLQTPSRFTPTLAALHLHPAPANSTTSTLIYSSSRCCARFKMPLLEACTRAQGRQVFTAARHLLWLDCVAVDVQVEARVFILSADICK